MKKTSSFLFILGILLNTSLFADHVKKKKLYLESATIKVTSDGIFLDLNGAYLPIDMVAKDSQGIFVTTYIDQTYVVVCAVCGKKINLDEQGSTCPHSSK